MVMGEIAREYELAIIGGGPAGYMAAIRAGQLGIDTVLIEKEDIGGTCLNRGCIPSKMLFSVAEHIHNVRQMKKIGVGDGNISVDMKRVREHNVSVVKKLRNGVEYLLKQYGIAVIKGVARFESSHYLHISNKNNMHSIRFKNAIVATGSSPRIPKGVRIGKNIITSREALFLKKAPKKIAIIGAGYVASELATFYSKFGSDVHILARSVLLSKMSRDLVRVMQKNMEAKVYEHSVIKQIKNGSKGAALEFISNGKLHKLNCDKIIMCIGRVPNTNDIGLEDTEVKVDEKGFIIVDERMRTSQPNIYACGDVANGPMLAHKAFMQGRVAVEAIAGIKSAGFDPAAIPSTVFTLPQIAVVGVSLAEAEKRGMSIKTAKFPFTALGRAVATGNEDGFVRILYENSGRIVGIEMVGRNVSEILGEAGLAVEMNAFLDDVSETIHVHPTMYEAMHEVAELALGKPMHYLQKFQ